MPRRNPPPEPVIDPTPHESGHTTPGEGGEPSPRLPHERDESSDSQRSPEPDDMMEQAHADLRRGLVDTDRGPVLDRVYEDEVRPEGEATRHRAASTGPAGAPATPAHRSGRPRR
ncbi:MAG: hypothetical protein JNM26_12480 [Ideonella sp.]|nr:hypothetical protein [Ideonella sp.]